jgi:hypothetical protein
MPSSGQRPFDRAMTGEEKSARVWLEVTAGVMEGQPLDEYTKRWYLSEVRWGVSDEKERAEEMAQIVGRAQGYAALLCLQPDSLNWVDFKWRWM